jgi:4-diphosphocytidyl-2-C-methyl-D-erythritol kinase
MIAFPCCKINLGIHVINKREDGFHNLETIFYPVHWCDMLEIVVDNESSKGEVKFISDGLTIEGNTENNLVIKAYNLFHQVYDLPAVKVFLFKKIPMGAGLGGGSSDAAYTLLLLNDLFSLQLTTIELEKYAAQLGSDCAYFIKRGVQLAKGRGELLEPIELDLKSYFLCLIKPDIHVSTAQAFSGVKKRGDLVTSLNELIRLPMNDWRNVIQNDFEESVFKIYPELASIKNNLYDMGSKYAAMSGSGSTILGLFEVLPDLSNMKKTYTVFTCEL